MTVKLFHTTKDSDLKQGLQVCYQDLNGAFTKLGVITDTVKQDGITLYLINTAMGAYAASELKLIEPEHTYKISFIGRLVGAIGKRYQITETVQAADKEAAELKLYDKYEHIAILGCAQINKRKASLK